MRGEGYDERIASATSEIADREGLPPTYRMRADRHYVDAVSHQSTDQPIRMVPVAQIDSGSDLPPLDLRPLIESIRVHGVVHPLLVYSSKGRYALIAGRKRLQAARILRVPAVPCLVRALDDGEALALANADNLVVQAPDHARDKPVPPTGVREVVAHHLAAIRAYADLVSSPDPAMGRSVLDLIRAHAWRAARLLDALDLVEDVRMAPGRPRPLSAVVDDVVRGFEPESRLNGFDLQAQIEEGVSSIALNDRELLAGISGAVLAILPLVESGTRPAVLIRATGSASSVVLEVARTGAPVSASVARDFFDDPSSARPGGCAAAAGAGAARALAHRHSGAAVFDASGPGSVVRLSLERPSSKT